MTPLLRATALALGFGLTASLRASSVLAAEPPAGSDDGARLLAQLAETARSERRTRAWLSLGSGAALTTAGLLDEADGDAGFGRVVWIAGALSLTGGVLSLFLPTPLERLERDAGARSASYTPSGLRTSWHDQADEARAARKIISVVHFVIGGSGFAAGGALAAGLGDWSDRRRENWAVQFFAGGTIFVSAGLAMLLIPSDVERGYDLAYPSLADAGLQINVAPLRDGATLQLCGAF